jgi:LCP family protein required for cell wall assembly
MKSIILLFIISILLPLSGKGQDIVFPVKTDTPSMIPLPPVKLIKTPEALGISKNVQIRNARMLPHPINIALFAVDRRNRNEEGNSDIIMIISIDQLTKKIKMSSILRDTYVNIEGKGMDKLNAAFSLGGPQLAIKTINQNFEMDIKDYINVDFFSAAKIINALNGVNVNVKAEEIPYLNNYLQEISGIENIPAQFITSPGIQKLNGKQAVAYTRIRAAGRGDYERTERQRSVLVALFNKMKGAGPDIFPVFATQILPNLETSMSNMALFTIGSDILNSKTKNIEQARFPLDQASKGERINTIWYLKTDLKSTSISLFNFIYKNIKPNTYLQ